LTCFSPEFAVGRQRFSLADIDHGADPPGFEDVDHRIFIDLLTPADVDQQGDVLKQFQLMFPDKVMRLVGETRPIVYRWKSSS